MARGFHPQGAAAPIGHHVVVTTRQGGKFRSCPSPRQQTRHHWRRGGQSRESVPEDTNHPVPALGDWRLSVQVPFRTCARAPHLPFSRSPVLPFSRSSPQALRPARDRPNDPARTFRRDRTAAFRAPSTLVMHPSGESTPCAGFFRTQGIRVHTFKRPCQPALDPAAIMGGFDGSPG